MLASCFWKMVFIDQNLKEVHMTYFSQTFDPLLINSNRKFLFEIYFLLYQRNTVIHKCILPNNRMMKQRYTFSSVSVPVLKNPIVLH